MCRELVCGCRLENRGREQYGFKRKVVEIVQDVEVVQDVQVGKVEVDEVENPLDLPDLLDLLARLGFSGTPIASAVRVPLSER